MNHTPLGILRITNGRLLVMCALFACAFLPVHAASLDDLTYTTTDGEVTITDCNENVIGEVVIPDTIGGNPVTSIGARAFFRCYSLKNILIGNGVTSIGQYAFYECALTSITIPDSVTSIGGGAFGNIFRLTDITIGRGVTSIGGGAFSSCRSLTRINPLSPRPLRSKCAFKALPPKANS